jgi:predicted TPR repeat methyltransferase
LELFDGLLIFIMSNLTTESSLQAMYDTYYEGDPSLLVKREITARQTLDHMKAVLGDQRFQRVIDVGAGEGSLLEQLDKTDIAEELYGVEISHSGTDIIRRKAIRKLKEVRIFDGYSMPYADQFFDVAISTHVLEHVEHERIFLYELKRVAKHILIEVPLEHTIDVQKAFRQSRPHGHINFYNPDTLRNLLETSGLKCVDLKLFPASRELEIFCSGKVKGAMKNRMRQTALSIAPKLATSMMSYMCMALCAVE